MGFSTSGSLLIVFIGLFIAVGSVYTTGSNTADRLETATLDNIETQTEIGETAINITEATQDSEGLLTIRINNTGSVDLSVAETSVIVDGTYRPLSTFETVTVDGEESDVWASETRLLLEADEEPERERIKIVTAVGVADTSRITEVIE